MTELDFEKLQIPEEAYKALKKAARRKDRLIQSRPDSLSTSTGLCQWTNQVLDGMGGMSRSSDSKLVITDDGINYVRWRQKKELWFLWGNTKKFFIFWIPTGISIAALIVSIIALTKQ